MGKGTLQHHYNSFFYMHKIAACCQVYKVKVKLKMKTPFHWYHHTLNKLNRHPHCCKNLNSCTGEILPVHAMKVDGVLEKVEFYAFLIIALDGVEESASCADHFNPRKRACDAQ